MTDLRFSKGEYGRNLLIPFTNTDGSVFDLTGYTIKFVMKDKVTGVNKINGTATTSGSPTLGIVSYTVASTDFNTVGTYAASVIITKTGEQSEGVHFTITIQDTAGT